MTGYGDSWGVGRQAATQSHFPLPLPAPLLHLAPTPFKTDRQRHSRGLSRWDVGQTLGPVCVPGGTGDRSGVSGEGENVWENEGSGTVLLFKCPLCVNDIGHIVYATHSPPPTARNF